MIKGCESSKDGKVKVKTRECWCGEELSFPRRCGQITNCDECGRGWKCMHQWENSPGLDIHHWVRRKRYDKYDHWEDRDRKEGAY